MSDKWITKNIDKFSIEELEKIDSYSNYQKFSVLVGFILGLFPQYTLLTHPYIRNYKTNGPIAKLCILGLIGVPFAFSSLVSYPVFYYSDKYILSLQEKYK